MTTQHSCSLLGYTTLRVDAVVKFGGSLLIENTFTDTAINALAECARNGYRLVVIPGGGPTDKAIESIDRRKPFAADTHHRACAMAQDQTGLMISDPAFGDALKACSNIEETRLCLDAGKVAVLLPSPFIVLLDPFERTWEITSDGIAAWFAWLLRTSRLIIMTDVDGIYPPGTIFEGPPLPEVTATILESWGKTSVDACLPPFIREHSIETWVLHGGRPGRILQAIEGKAVEGTRIVPK